MERSKTPPRTTRSSARNNPPHSPPTPEVTKRIEESRLKAKAIRDQYEVEQRAKGQPPTLNRTPSGFIANDSRKRPYNSISRDDVPSTQRDARNNGASGESSIAGGAGGGSKADEGIQAARKFTKYVEYDFSKMTDTRGGFMTAEDDPHNKALHSTKDGEKPAHMTLKEWERHQLLKKLRHTRQGPFEPGLTAFGAGGEERKKCRECGSLEIDWTWEEVFKCAVCGKCKEEFPEKYSLLTKTECRDDYLITDPELKDTELLPHLSKPNPHKSHWHDMMLFLRYQVEDYAFSPRKWGSPEALDAEFEKREIQKKQRKEEKFKSKLQELKRKTRTEAFRRENAQGGAGTARFGDLVGGNGRHEHEWGRTVENAEGLTVKTCVECGMEVEELEF